MIGFVYIWRDRSRKMFYIGSHIGQPDDGYTGCGTRFIRAYRVRPGDFKRRILQIVDGESHDLRRAEENWLALIKLEELGVKYYNLMRAGYGFDRETAKRASILGNRAAHAVKTIDGKSALAVKMGNATASVVDETGKSVHLAAAGRKGGIKGGPAAAKIIHALKDEKGKSLHGIRLTSRIHALKNEDGKSIHAIRIGHAANAVKDASGKSINALNRARAANEIKDNRGKSANAVKGGKLGAIAAHQEKLPDGRSATAVKAVSERWRRHREGLGPRPERAPWGGRTR